MDKIKAKPFPLGQKLTTRGITIAMEQDKNFANEIRECFLRYCNLDWGDTCKEDCEMNNYATRNGQRIVAKYETSKGDVFIITEWNRSATTILFSDEY